MNSQITEFSFGFALTHELINNAPILGPTAPEFPSLIQEGAPGGGYDVALDFGVFLFLQFKLSEYMIGNAAGEAETMGVPYYRFWIMPTSESQQHPMLLELEAADQVVYYAAPIFWTQDQFNDAFAQQQVAPSSIFVPPSSIGAIADTEPHPVAFNGQGAAYVFSRPTKILAVQGGDLLASIAKLRKQNAGERRSVEETERSMSEIAKRRKFKVPAATNIASPRERLANISFLAHAFFQVEAFFIPAADEG